MNRYNYMAWFTASRQYQLKIAEQKEEIEILKIKVESLQNQITELKMQ